MVETNKPYSLVRGKVMRVTQLDSCGAKNLGPNSTVVTDGFVSVALAANNAAGVDIEVVNANGKTCIRDVPCPEFLGYDLTITLCGVNPELWNLFTGQPKVFDVVSLLATGMRVNSDVNPCDNAFAIELWSNVPDDACSGAAKTYGYLLLPFVTGGSLGDFSVENNALNFTINGARTKKLSQWGVGPYLPVAGAAGVPAALSTAINPGDHLHMQLTNIAPPTPSISSIPLGTLATGATAGIPATLTPANSYAPANLAAAIALAGAFVASPATNWTAGQYVLWEDGTKGRWNGTAWVVAP